MYEKCKDGLHPLKEITRIIDGFVDKVIRWCPDCGAIVIDMECDGRVYPGHYRRLVLPRVIKENRTNIFAVIDSDDGFPIT